MTAISVVPRPLGVAQENASTRRGPRAAKPLPRVSKAELRDAMALNSAINRRNAGRKGRARIENTNVAVYAAPLGGSRHAQVWGDYRNGKRHIPARDKLIAALYLQENPGALFPSLREFSLWDMLRLVLQHGSAAEQLLFSELAGQFAAMTRAQRVALLAKLKNL